jgi:hypothetical protein
MGTRENACVGTFNVIVRPITVTSPILRVELWAKLRYMRVELPAELIIPNMDWTTNWDDYCTNVSKVP